MITIWNRYFYVEESQGVYSCRILSEWWWVIIIVLKKEFNAFLNLKLHLQSTSSPARWFCGLLFMPSFLFKMYLSTCKKVLRISFLSIFIFTDISGNLGVRVSFLSIFFLRWRWQDGWRIPSNRQAPPVSPM